MSYNLGSAEGTIKITADTSGADQAAKKTDEALQKIGKSSSQTQQDLDKVGSASGAAALAIAGGFALAVNTAANFEQGLSNIKAVSGATDAEMKKISDTALRIGKDTTFSATEAAQAIEELSKAGISVDDILNGAADAAVNLAAAGGVDLPTAATIASNAMNAFGLTAADMVGVVDQIAGASNASAIDVNDFGQSLSQVGAVASLAGLSFDDTAIAIAEMGNAGIKGSDAGTSLKTMLMNLQPQTKKQSELMQELGLITADGTNQFYDQEGKLKSLRDIQDVLSTSLTGMTDAQKQAALETIFGSDAIRAAAILTDEGAAGYDKMAEAMGKVSAADVAETRLDNFKGSLEGLKGSLETVGIQIGMVLIPYLRAFVDWVSSVVDGFGALSPTLQEIIIIGGLVAGGLLSAVWAASKIYNVFSTASAAVRLLSKAFDLLKANPIVLIILAIIALGVALYELYQHSETFRNIVGKAWDFVKDAAARAWAVIEPILKWFKELWDALVDAFQTGDWGSVWDKITEGLSNVWDVLKDLGKKLGGYILDALSWVGSQIPGWIANAWSWLTDDFTPWLIESLGDLGSMLGEWFVTAWDFLAENVPGWVEAALSWLLVDFLPWLLEGLGDLGATLGNWFMEAMFWVGSNLPGWVATAFAWLITEFIPWLIGSLGDLAGLLLTWFGEALSWVGTNLPPLIWDLIVFVFTQLIPWIVGVLGDLAGALWEWIWGAIKAVGGLIAGLATTIASWFVNFLSWAIGGLGDLAGAIWNWIWGAIKWVGNKIGSIASEVGGWLAGFVSWIVSGIGDLGAALWDKILGGLTWLKDKILGFFKDIKDAISKALDDIFSLDESKAKPTAPGAPGSAPGDYADQYGPGEVPALQNFNESIKKSYDQATADAQNYSTTAQDIHAQTWEGVNSSAFNGAQAMARYTSEGNSSAQSSTQSAWSAIFASIFGNSSASASQANSAWAAILNGATSGNNGTASNTQSAWASIFASISGNSSSAQLAAVLAFMTLLGGVSNANSQASSNTGRTWADILFKTSSGSQNAANAGTNNMRNMVIAIQQLGGAMMAAGNYIMNMLGIGMAQGSHSATNVAQGTSRAIAGAFYGLSLYGAGYNIMLGLAYGISAAGGIAISRAQAVVSAINATVARTAKIASPSKVMIYYGTMMGLGLALGLDDQLSNAVDIASDRMADMFNALTGSDVLTVLATAPHNSATADGSQLAKASSEAASTGNLTIEKLEINNPKPETASNSMAVGIRKAAYTWSGK